MSLVFQTGRDCRLDFCSKALVSVLISRLNRGKVLNRDGVWLVSVLATWVCLKRSLDADRHDRHIYFLAQDGESLLESREFAVECARTLWENHYVLSLFQHF